MSLRQFSALNFGLKKLNCVVAKAPDILPRQCSYSKDNGSRNSKDVDFWKLRASIRRRSLSPFSRVEAMVDPDSQKTESSSSNSGTVKSEDPVPEDQTSMREENLKGDKSITHFSRKPRRSLSPLHRYSAALTNNPSNQNTDKDAEKSVEDLKKMEDDFKAV